MNLVLAPHVTTPPSSIRCIKVTVWQNAGSWHFRYLVEGAAGLVLPAPQEPGRADELWKTTCFEAFVAGRAGSYTELNFSPSGQWASYDFDAPREGMRNSAITCDVWLEGADDWIAVEAAFSGELSGYSKLGLSAVIEEDGGIKSYWALSHCSEAPDFHDPDCFVARLA